VSKPLSNQRQFEFLQWPAVQDDDGRPCLACGSATRIVRGNAYRGPVERCVSCKLERELPRPAAGRYPG
jgi:hypothetical protein